MIALAGNFALLAVWITFSAVVLVGVTAVLIWAVRSGQFSGQAGNRPEGHEYALLAMNEASTLLRACGSPKHDP